MPLVCTRNRDADERETKQVFDGEEFFGDDLCYGRSMF
jgi:hypothetical protein